MGLIKDIRDIQSLSNNPFNITKEDLIGDLMGVPLGVVVRMLEETKKQGNKPDIKVFQNKKINGFIYGGFDWDLTDDGHYFWSNIIRNLKFDEFYNRYPEYKQYDY